MVRLGTPFPCRLSLCPLRHRALGVGGGVIMVGDLIMGMGMEVPPTMLLRCRQEWEEGVQCVQCTEEGLEWVEGSGWVERVEWVEEWQEEVQWVRWGGMDGGDGMGGEMGRGRGMMGGGRCGIIFAGEAIGGLNLAGIGGESHGVGGVMDLHGGLMHDHMHSGMMNNQAMMKNHMQV